MIHLRDEFLSPGVLILVPRYSWAFFQISCKAKASEAKKFEATYRRHIRKIER